MRLLNPIIVIISVLFRLFSTDVIFLNSSRGGTKYLAPILYVLARFSGRMFVFRPFGGNIKDYTASYGSLVRWVFEHSVLRADILFLQTYQLMAYYKNFANCRYLPTSRNRPAQELTNGERGFRKRFVFIGFVTPDKGIEELMAASDTLDDSYTTHIYGPIKSRKYESWQIDSPEIYKGVLESDTVLERLTDYDVLVLPTYYDGEGYPGVIIEAYSLGIPVITTNWAAIPEIVEDRVTGRIIDIQSVDGLVEAMESFTSVNYNDYSVNAKSLFETSFEVNSVGKTVVENIESHYSKAPIT